MYHAVTNAIVKSTQASADAICVLSLAMFALDATIEQGKRG